MDDIPVIDFDWTLDPKSLREIYKTTNFDVQFQKLIAKDVIRVLSPQLVSEPHNLIYDDELIYKHLIGPLERIICHLPPDAAQEEVDSKLEQLKTLKQPSKVCRKVLKTGDVLFSCNDCGLDETCVVCIDCFHKSAHKDHNYRMSNTEGGGCCDCGDHEAWRQNPACSDHQATDQPNLTLSDYEDIELRKRQIESDRQGILDKISLLPSGFAARYFLICQASLHYARMMLAWENFQDLPPELQIDTETLGESEQNLVRLLSKEPSSKNYFTVLFNDEIHTFDYVIQTLVKIIKCTNSTASIMASSVSREGRSFILQDNYRPCKQVSDTIAQNRDSGQKALKVEVMHGSILAHQAYALKLIEWIKEMSLICDAFRVLTAYTIMGTFDPSPFDRDSKEMTMLEKVMRSNTTYWKMARVDWNDLLVATLLTEYSIKEQFARVITRNYSDLVDDFIKDDHDHSVSILTMTTQLYTVPSLICMLIEEENALSVIAKKLIDVCRSTKRENNTMTFENRFTFDMQGLKRGLYMIPDMRHLINIEPTKWTDGLRANVIEAVIIFLDLLDSMQNMDSVKRQLGQHLEYEQEWETGMTLQSRLIGLISRLVTYCSFDETVLMETLRETQRRLFTKFNNFKTVKREMFGHEANCIQYDVSTLAVSVHLPLTRFAAALILELMHRRPCDQIPYDQSQIILTESMNGMIDVMEHSLRTQVMIAQFRSGVWRRNGFSLSNQVRYYAGAFMRKEMFDRDILALQECGATTEPNQFLIHLINKFNLITWVTSETPRDLPVGTKASLHNDEESWSILMAISEEFLQLLLTIISERYRVGVGKVTSEQVIENEIIQLLCIGPYTRSDITQKLFYNDHEIDCIKTVAHLRRSSELSTGKYELKNEFYDRFNPYFYHYNRQHQSQALDAQLKRKRQNKEKLICCPPPKPVELTPPFRNLTNLLKCDISLLIIQRVLRRITNSLETCSESSSKLPIRFTATDSHLDQCLHLVGLGLHEQERDLEFDYLAAAQSKKIWSLLKYCHATAKRSRDLIFWLMQKGSRLLDRVQESDNEVDKRQCDLVAMRQCFDAVLAASDLNKQESQKRNSALAAQRRERIMAMMKRKQEKFLSNPATKELAAETARHEVPKAATSGERTAATSSQPQQDLQQQTSMDFEILNSDTEAPCRTEDTESVTMTDEATEDIKDLYESVHICILCRDQQRITFNELGSQNVMVLLAYVQRSSVLSKNRTDRRIPNYALTPSNQLRHHVGKVEKYSYTSDNGYSFDATHMPADLFFGPHLSTCGHAMHYICWQEYSSAVLRRETTRPNNRGARHISYELDKNELLCPLCECISNATIPLLPDFTRFNRDRFSCSVFKSSAQTIEESSEHLTAFLHALKNTVATYQHVRHLNTTAGSSRTSSTISSSNYEDKYMRLLQPTTINDVLKELDENEALVLRDFIATIRNNKVQSSMCPKDLLTSIQTLAERIHSVGLDLDRTVTNVHHARIFMMTTWSISYTIQAHERAIRFKGYPLLEDLESSKSLCLGALIRFACASMMTHQSDMIQSLLVQKLRYLLISEEHQMSSPSLLDIDAFELFVSIFVMLQKLYSHIDETHQQPMQTGPLDLNISSTPAASTSDNEANNSSTSLNASAASTNSNYAWTTTAYDHEYFRNLLHLMVIFNLLQVAITIQTYQSPDDDDDDDEMDSSDEDAEAVVLHNFYKDIILASGHPNSKLQNCNKKFVERIKCDLLPFLRSCAIFFYQLSHVAPNQTLRTQSAFFEGKNFVSAPQEAGKSSTGVNIIDSSEEFAAICEYLGLPDDFGRLLRSREARNLALSWLRHSRVLLLIKSAIAELSNEQDKQQQQQQKQQQAKMASSLKRVGSSSSAISQHQSSSQQATSSGTKNDLMPIKLIRQPHSVNRLIDLPYDYSELVDRVSNFTCPSIKNEDSRTPTMCLVCGVMLCSYSYCCRRDLNGLAANYQQALKRQEENQQQSLASNASLVEAAVSSASAGGQHPVLRHAFLRGSAADTAASLHAGAVAALSVLFPQGPREAGPAHHHPTTPATDRASRLSSSSPYSIFGTQISQQLVGSCTYHAHECSGGVGVFLRIRSCQILLLSGRSKGCYMPAPYIDDHGETDFGLVRGNPLHLNRLHYERLQHLWMNHAIPKQISRSLEYSSYAATINWHLH